jgi:hypothetical protein
VAKIRQKKETLLRRQPRQCLCFLAKFHVLVTKAKPFVTGKKAFLGEKNGSLSPHYEDFV